MFDGPKEIPSPFTGRKNQKAWKKTREKYMSLKEDKIQLKQAGDHITIKRNGQKNFQTVKVHFTMKVKLMRVIITVMVIRSSDSATSRLKIDISGGMKNVSKYSL